MKIPSVKLTPRQFFLGMGYYIFQLLILGPALIVGFALLRIPLDLMQLNLVFYGINFVAILLIFHKFLWKNLKIAIKKPFSLLGHTLLGFILYYIVTIAVGMIMVMIRPDFANANDEAIAQMLEQNFPMMAFATVILVPIAEECFYRGLIFNSLGHKNKFLGYFVSMLVFSLVHVVGYIGQYDLVLLALSVLQYLPAGLFLAWVYAKTDSIMASTLMHMLINLIGTFAMRYQ